MKNFTDSTNTFHTFFSIHGFDFCLCVISSKKKVVEKHSSGSLITQTSFVIPLQFVFNWNVLKKLSDEKKYFNDVVRSSVGLVLESVKFK